MANLPVRLALTTGDPAGIGPELVVKALANESWVGQLIPVVVGDSAVLREAIAGCGLDLRVRSVETPEQARGEAGMVDVVDCRRITAPVRHGTVAAEYGAAAVHYIERACVLARDGHVDGLVTGPINKQSIWQAGSEFPGHTEMLANFFQVPAQRALTMFQVRALRIFFLSRHMSLAEAIRSLSAERITEFSSLVHDAVQALGVLHPHIAVAALNPHAGENGNFGREEIDILAPGIEQARSRGVDVVGPIPADAVFHQGLNGTYDAVISLFHDQGHIAAKTLDFFGTVSCELGLPVIRTTVDSGTAFDIAGTWVANPDGEISAMLTASVLALRVLAGGKHL